ncbi:MAG TPA: hypothetical protein PKD63_02205 [Solirubrobacteraceae bacterium]|nr:hypothetical protein [Solirubrobacteraceae bacterium]
MRLYPTLPADRTRTIAGDIIVVALLVLFVWSGMKVHDTVNELTAITAGVRDAGTSVQDGFANVAGAVDAIPLVGGALADSLKTTGGATGGNVVSAANAGETAVNDTATVLGWVTFTLPTLVLLAFFVPLRGRQIRRLTNAHHALGGPVSEERRRLLAMRAAFGMDWGDLRPFTKDPIGDLEAGRLEPLIAALYADAGLAPPGPATTVAAPGTP